MKTLVMFQIFVIYIVISIVNNFLIKAFSLTEKSKTEVVLPTYQLYKVTFLIKAKKPLASNPCE